MVIFPVTPEIWNNRSPSSCTELNLQAIKDTDKTTGQNTSDVYVVTNVLLCDQSRPDSPQVVKQALFQLRKQQRDGGLCIHADDSLASTQRRVSHILILISQSLLDDRKRTRAMFQLLEPTKSYQIPAAIFKLYYLYLYYITVKII